MIHFQNFLDIFLTQFYFQKLHFHCITLLRSTVSWIIIKDLLLCNSLAYKYVLKDLIRNFIILTFFLVALSWLIYFFLPIFSLGTSDKTWPGKKVWIYMSTVSRVPLEQCVCPSFKCSIKSKLHCQYVVF